MKIRFTKFVVIGRGVFPFDMLRYDSCYPMCPEDAGRLAELDKRAVALVTVSHVAPTIGRWNSFGWQVIAEGEAI